MKTINIDQIRNIIEKIDVTSMIEDGFVAYSEGKAVVPPVGELIFNDPPGETHIKYGYLKGDDYYIIKIASGFPENFRLNLPSCSGMMLLFYKNSGIPASILLDEGFLTNVRTAVAGKVAAKYLAPKKVSCIGVFGTGIQGRMQVKYLKEITDCRKVIVWGLPQDNFDSYKTEMELLGYQVTSTSDSEKVTRNCNLIITSTPSKSPLIYSNQILPGTHITAMGSDTPMKQELDPEILQIADIVVADSISQCKVRGEIYKGLLAGTIQEEKVVEIGNVIKSDTLQRVSNEQITVCDLTGVAIQDLQIAKAVHSALT